MNSKFIIGAIALSATACGVAEQEQLPNILFILIDDAGYADFGFAGSEVMKTPNIDKLASESVILTDMHVSGSVSGPSRCGAITGRYQQRFGGETNDSAEVGVPLNERLTPQYLKERGYATAAFGKWHLGSNEEYHPNKRGFDEFYGFLGGHRNYFSSPKDLKDKTKGIQHNGVYEEFDGYLTDVLGDRAIDFIDANKENPFYIYLSYNAVHTPLQATKEDLALFEGSPRQSVAAMTWALDRSIGNVINKLEEEDLIDNTLIVFLSDNGGDTPKCNYPLKANKGTEFEGGHRVVSFMKWGDRFINGKYDALSSSLDLLPTFLDVAGVEVGEESNLDGVSLIPFLTGKSSGVPHDWLFWRIERWRAVRYNNYKYIYAEGVGDVLYDLDECLQESVDISQEQPEIKSLMQSRLREWESTLVAPLKRGSTSWAAVKAYMYEDLFNNIEPRYTSPSQLKNIK